MKGTLIGLALMVLSAITVNFLNRIKERPVAPPIEPLGSDTSQLSTQVEFRNYKGGEVDFQVRSAESRLSGQGLQTLGQVNLDIYRPPDRKLTEHVWADSASYRSATNSVAFEKNVTITLHDQTVITSDRASADLAAKFVRISEGFRIQRGDVKGEGRSLFYDAARNLLLVHDGIHLTIPSELEAIEISAQEARYHPRLGHLVLVGNAEIKNTLQTLSSDEVHLWLSKKGMLKEMNGLGAVVFENQHTRAEGDELKVHVDPNTGLLLKFYLAMQNQDHRALYRGSLSAGAPILRARVITGLPAEQVQGTAIELQEITAVDQVEIEWPEAGIESASAERLTAVSSSGSYFETLDLEGGVELLRQEEGSKETILSERLRLTLAPGPTLEILRAEGKPFLIVEQSGNRRTLSAEHEITIRFRRGKLYRLDTEGTSTILEQADNQRTFIRASRLTNSYREGVPVSLLASGPIRMERGSEEQPLIATAQEMRVHYTEDGELRDSELLGELKLRQRTQQGEIEVKGNRGLISTGGKIFKVIGDPPLLQSMTETGEVSSSTTASSFWLNPMDLGIEAKGPVETQLFGGDPVIIKAGGMKVEGGSPWITYDGRPQLKMGMNTIESDQMRLDSRRLQLEAEGSIRAFLHTAQGTKTRGYEVMSNRLILDRESHQALFVGDVKADSEDMEIKASRLTVHFNGSDLEKLVRMVAVDGVTMVNRERKALGDKAVYVPADGTVTVTGTTAQVIDSKQGKAIGSKLTFNLGDDTLLIEGEP